MAVVPRLAARTSTDSPPTTKLPSSELTSPAADVPVLPLIRIRRELEMFSARRNKVNSNRVVGNEVNSTGRNRYRDTTNTITDTRMSVTIRKSSTNPGSGVISGITMASMASGTTSSPSVSRGRFSSHFGRLPAVPGAAMALVGVMLSRHPPVHQLEDVGQNFGHRAVEMRRDLLADFDGFVKRLRQRRILHDRHLMLDRYLPDAQRQVVLALGNHQRRRHAVHVVSDGHGEVRRVD